MKRLGIRTRLAIVVALVTALTTTVLGLGTFQTVVYEVTDFGVTTTNLSPIEAERSTNEALATLRAALVQPTDDTDRRVAVESEIRDRQAEMDDIEARIQQLEGRVDEADERDEPDEPDGRDEVDQRDGDGDGAQRDQLMDEVMQLRDSLVQQQDSIGDGRQQLADLDNQKEDALQQVRGRISDLRDQSFNFTLFTADGTPENEAQLLRRISGTDPGEVVGRAVCRSGVADVSCTVDGSSRLGDLVQAEWDAVGQGLGGVVVGESVLFETTDGETAEIDIVMSRDLRAEANSEIALDAITRAALLLTLLLGGITWFAVGWALRPVRAMTNQVAGISNDSLHQRIPVPPASDDVRALADTMNDMLDRLQQAQDRQRQFVSDASHELRSPITATQATLEVATSNPDGTDWDHTASILQEENVRLASLVDDLLLLARLDEQQVLGGITPVDLDELCLTEAARSHPIDIAVRVEAPARVNGNLSMLTRAIRNLADNAAAHAKSAVTIAVNVQADGRSVPYAVVQVDDDGPGIPAENQERVFERFTRLDEARQRSGGAGAGLGLAIVKSIAEAHGGSVQVKESALGGARLTLAIPLPPTVPPPQ